MGDNIISVKRTAFDDYQRGLLFKEIDAMKSQLAQLAQPAPQQGDDDADEGSTGTAAFIAAVLAAMALLVGCFAYSKGRSAAAGASGTMLGRPEV